MQRAIEEDTLTQASSFTGKPLTDDELKERFCERQRNRRLEDFEEDNFDQLIEIDDPFSIFKNAERPDSDDDDSDANFVSKPTNSFS